MARELVEKINHLTKKEKYHILLILQKHNIEYTKNSNGFFFNMVHITPGINNEIEECLKLIETNRTSIRELELKRDKMYKSFKELVESRLILTQQKTIREYVNTLQLQPYTDIVCTVNRIFRFEHYNNKADPDELLKEYQKTKSMPKNSVFARLQSKMKAIKSKSSIRKSLNRNNIENHDNLFDYNDCEEECEENIEENNDYEDDIEDQVEIEDNLLDEQRSDSVDDDIETESVNSETSSNQQAFKKDYEFYKDILNKRGFVFTDNKTFVTLQEYIE